jgi:hypothetical protein
MRTVEDRGITVSLGAAEFLTKRIDGERPAAIRQHVYGSGVVLVVDDEPEAAKLLGGTEHGDDYDWGLGEFWIGFEGGQHSPTIQSWHQHIEREDIGMLLARQLRARSRRRSLRDHTIAFQVHRRGQKVAGVWIVVDNHHQGRMFSGG